MVIPFRINLATSGVETGLLRVEADGLSEVGDRFRSVSLG
jgi:hypothetical protein